VRLFIKKLGKGEIYINDQRVRFKKWIEIARSDKVSIGASRIYLNIQAGVFDARSLIGLESQKLVFKGGRKTLCNNIFLRSRPGTVTAIMGASGCGKSVFMNLINGYKKPQSGRVFLIEYARDSVGSVTDVHRNFDSVRDRLGYVPQADIMIPELTVRQSLRYRLKLRFPDMRRSVADKYIAETCSSLGFDVLAEREEFLDTRIGSSDSKGKVLSGGQRRRANIAHELVVKPQVLLLDEPTSGLSSVDADLVIKTLKRLAVEEKLAIVLVVHQPSAFAFSLFDRLLLIERVGNLVYYGAAADAVSYFSQLAGEKFEGHSPAEFILKVCDEAPTSQLIARFEKAEYRPKSIAEPVRKNVRATVDKRSFMRHVKGIVQFPRELLTLTLRNLRVFFADYGGFFLTFVQVPLIALLMWAAFHNLYDDHRQDDDLFRKHYCLIQELDKAESDGRGGLGVFSKSLVGASLNIVFGAEKEKDALFDKYYDEVFSRHYMSRAEAKDYVGDFRDKYDLVFDKVSLPTASLRAVVIFSLILAAIWLGMMGSCIEIVKERAILSREKRSCLRVSSYLFSKTVLKSAVVGLQLLLLAALIVPKFLDYSLARSGYLYLTLWITGIAASVLGLFVSSISFSQRMALMAVPILLIPQILFGGVLRPGGLVQGTSWPRYLGMATVQRWAFDAAVAYDPLARRGILYQFAEPPNVVDKYTRWEARVVGVKEQGLHQLYFGDYAFGYVRSLSILGGAVAILLFGSYLVLKRKE
jgi:ABC-type multidrug transport system ATPase subunit